MAVRKDKKSGKWRVDVWMGANRIRRLLPDKRTAQLVEKDLKLKEARSEYLGIRHVKQITFEAFCNEFLSRLVGRAQNTVRNYEKACRIHFIPFFGSRYLADIQPKHVEDYQQERAKTAKFSTVNQELRMLKSILNAAVRRGHLKESPAKLIKPLTVPQKEPPYMTRDQVAKLLPHCTDWLHTFIAIALNTGMRISEILALEWEDIDIRKRVIKIRCDEEFTTKGRRNREISVNDFLSGILSRLPRHITNSHVIVNRDGNVPHEVSVRSRFVRALKRAGLPRFRIHDMRHTYGTTLAANGVDVVTIQRLMGHTDIKTTMQYLHAAPDRMQWAAESLHLDGTTQEELDNAKEGSDGGVLEIGG